MVVECQQERRVASRRISDRTSSRCTAILVCGMHRCGTSALTRVLSFLGAALPIDVYPAGPGNEMGHWEPRDLGPLHDRVLASVGTHWASLVPGNERSLESEIPNQFRSEIRRLILEQYGDEALFVVKDPRLSLLLPLWIDVLGELEINPRITVIACGIRLKLPCRSAGGMILITRHTLGISTGVGCYGCEISFA